MMMMRSLLSITAVGMLAVSSPAVAQVASQPTGPQAEEPIVDVIGGISAPMGIAIPPMPTSEVVATRSAAS
jgi:TolB protein